MTRAALILSITSIAAVMMLIGTPGCGGRAGSGDGGAGGGGAGGDSAGAGGGEPPLTSCPAQMPSSAACTGTFACEYEWARTCLGRCFSRYSCINGTLTFTDANDGCIQPPSMNCPDGGAGTSSGGSGGGTNGGASGGGTNGGAGGGGSGGAGGRGGAGATGGTGGRGGSGVPCVQDCGGYVECVDGMLYSYGTFNAQPCGVACPRQLVGSCPGACGPVRISTDFSCPQALCQDNTSPCPR